MGTSRIEQIIQEIYEFVESCKMQTFSTTKVVVPKDELYDLLDELRLRTPDEIKRYQKIIANRDGIIAGAEERAAEILASADVRATDLLEEHEIMQQAYQKADGIVESAMEEADRLIGLANSDAHQIREGAMAYAEEMLGSMEGILTDAYDSVTAKFESVTSKFEGVKTALKDNLNIVIENKNELVQQTMYEQVEENIQDGEEEADGDFEFDENTFLDEADK